MSRTKIQWTDETWNPIRGCSLVSAGCANCYAMKQAHRFSGPGRPYEGLTEIGPQGPRWTGPVRLVPEVLDLPLRWKKPRRIFVNSMSDLFHEDVPMEFIAAVFGIMAARPDHIFQILTKRPERMRGWFSWLADRGGLGPYIRSIRADGDRTLPNFFNAVAKTEIVRGERHRSLDDPWMRVLNAAACCGPNPLDNAWLGVSVEDQQTADKRIPLLLQTPAAVRWVSVEPLLGPTTLRCLNPIDDFYTDALDTPDRSRRLNWVVCGGESGPNARPCDIGWIRSIVEQCRGAHVPCFVKQFGSRPYQSPKHDGATGFDLRLHDRKGGDPSEWPEDLRVREWPQ